MKKIFMLAAALAAIAGSFAQTTEDFNSRRGADLHDLKGFLQNHCWQFHNFNINDGWDPDMEGDGAMVSASDAYSTQNTGIYTPLLSLNGPLDISFTYRLSAIAVDRRWLKIYAVSENNHIVSLLDSLELTGTGNNKIYTYRKQADTHLSGCYKIYINYQGIGGNNRIAIDQLALSAGTCYSGGCNQPPVAADDYFGGSGLHTATGNVLSNDNDPEQNSLTAQLLTNAADGNVVLQPDGQFTFTPRPGFTGNTTSFTYIVCDNGSPSLCSDPATAYIIFQPQGALPVTITDLGAAYLNDRVTLKWTTTFEWNNDHFEVERSTDGMHFTAAGSLAGQGNSASRHDYNFNDEVSRNILNRNDLYYRLKQVDRDGKSAYTKVLVVRVYHTRSLQSLSITPNPAVNDIRINAALNENAYIVMKVTNGSGAEIMRKSSRCSSGTNNFSLEGSSRLQPGIYFLEVIVNSNERMVLKLIKN